MIPAFQPFVNDMEIRDHALGEGELTGSRSGARDSVTCGLSMFTCHIGVGLGHMTDFG